MVAMFQESLDVLTEKEVEKRAPKKGIIASAAKDTLKEVVDDDLVRKDKVGVSWYFWSFPSDKQAKDQAQLAALRREAAREGSCRRARAGSGGGGGGAGRRRREGRRGRGRARAAARAAARAVQREDQALEAEKAVGLQRAEDVAARRRQPLDIHEIKKVCVDKFRMEKGRFEKASRSARRTRVRRVARRVGRF